jgi:hypothetical protein
MSCRQSSNEPAMPEIQPHPKVAVRLTPLAADNTRAFALVLSAELIVGRPGN